MATSHFTKHQKAMPNFAVIHIEKGSGNSTGIGQHIDRTRCPKNADEKKQHLNLHLINKDKSLSLCINERIAKGYTKSSAIRKDAVKSLRIILSGSHEKMTEISKNKELFNSWIKKNGEFLFSKFGRENVVKFSLHMDEHTPHIHAVVVPLTKDGRLSAKDLLGGPRGMELLQDEYAESMKIFSLERGLRGSTAKHTDIRQFYALANNLELMKEKNYIRFKQMKPEIIPKLSENSGEKEKIYVKARIVKDNSNKKLNFDI